MSVVTATVFVLLNIIPPAQDRLKLISSGHLAQMAKESRFVPGVSRPANNQLSNNIKIKRRFNLTGRLNLLFYCAKLIFSPSLLKIIVPSSSVLKTVTPNLLSVSRVSL